MRLAVLLLANNHIVANTLDGGKEMIEKRLKIYG